jgi:hypothetical protein
LEFHDQDFLHSSSALSAAGIHQYRGISGLIRSAHSSIPSFMENAFSTPWMAKPFALKEEITCPKRVRILG